MQKPQFQLSPWHQFYFFTDFKYGKEKKNQETGFPKIKWSETQQRQNNKDTN